jgi:hypothetical protein
MADKDPSKDRYYVGPSVTPSTAPSPRTPSVKKVGKVPVPAVNDRYSIGNATTNVPKAPISQKPAPRNFDEAVNQQLDDLRDKAVGGLLDVGGGILGVAGTAIDAISMGLSYGAGKERAIKELTEKGIVTNGTRMYMNAKIDPTGTGQGVAVLPEVTVTDPEQAALINEFIEDAARGNATAWTRGDKVSYGAQVLFGDKEEYSLGEIAAGISYDITNDPLSYAGRTAVTAVKSAVNAGTAAIKAAKSALGGDVSAAVVAKKTGVIPDAAKTTIKEPVVKVKKSEIATARALGVDITPEIERITRLGTYTTTKVPTMSVGPLNLNIGLVTSSALEAGQKALLSTVRSDLVRDTLNDILKGNVSRVAGTVVAREGEEWVVKNLAGEKIGSAADKKSAKEIAKEFKVTANSKEVGKVPVTQLPASTIRQGEDGAPASVEVPAEDGGQVVLELNTPHQASDGSVWIYDGTNVKAFTDMEGAQASLVQKAEAPKATVAKSGKEFSVRAGDYIETFRTREEAAAAAKAYNTGKTVAPSRVASGKKPALDLTPAPQLTFADISKGKVTTKEGSALKKILKNLDEMARQTPGKKLRLAMSNQRLLRRIIRTGFLTNPDSLRYLYRAFRGDFENAIKLAKVDGEIETPYTLLKMLQATAKGGSANAEDAKWISDLVSSVVIRVENSLVPLGKLPEIFPDFVKDVPSYVSKQVGEKLQEILDNATDLAKSKNPAARTEARAYDSIASVFGEDIANQVKATGVLKSGTAETLKKFELLEAKLMNQYENVTYKNLDELISGLRAGESVNADALLKIFKEIDPENQITKSTVKALDNGTGEMLRDIFLKEGAQTIANMKKKVALSGDVEELMGINGIGYDDILAQAIKYMQKPTKSGAIDFIASTKLSEEWIQNAILKESPAEQAKLFSESVSPLTGRSWNPGDDIIALALRGAWSNKFDLMDVIENSDKYVETVSSLNQKVKKISDENYVSNTGAVLPNVFTQADELRVIGKVTALTRARIEKGIKSKGGPNTLTPANTLGKEKQLELRNVSADKQIDELIYQMDLASATLSYLGIRITRLKEANDWAFDAAYKAEVDLAKLENRPVSYSRAKDAHFAYLHMGDVFRAFTENDARDLLRQGFYPVTSKENAPKNTLSFMGLGDAARRVLELDGKQSFVDNVELVEELANRILQKSVKMKEPTSSFAAKRKEIASQMAEHLLKPETVAILREAHLTKAVGSADRWIREAETISDDILNNLREGMRAANAVGDTSDSIRLNVVRQHLRRLALAGNIFSAQGGRYAEDIFNVYAMQFAQYGKLPVSPDAPQGTVLKILDDQEKALLRTQLYLFDMQTAPERAQIQAAAGLKYKKPAEIEAIQNKLTLAQESFDEVMSRIITVREGGTSEVAAWEREYQKAKNALNKARKNAVESGIPTYHYQGGQWVPSEQYNPEIARQLAEEMEAAYVAGQAGLIARSVVDEAPVVPEYKLLTGKKLKEALKRENVILTNGRVDNSIKHGEEIAASMANNIGRNDEAIGDLAISSMQEMQELELKMLTADMDLPPTVHYADDVIPEVMRVDVEFDSFFGGDKAVATSQLGEKFSSFRNKEDIIALARREETAGMLRSTNTARYLTVIQRQYKDVAPADFADALGYAIATGKIPKSVTGIQREIAMKVRPMIGPIREALKGMNKDGLLNSLQRFGLNKDNGYIIDEKDLNQNLESIFDSLPFIKKAGAKTDDEQARLQQLARLQESGVHPLQVLENLVKAVAITKAEQGLAANITANFGWKTHFDNFEQAVKAGWVAIEAVGSGQKSNIINALPSPKDGALFPPEIASQVGAAVRHWNEILTKPRNEIVRQVSQWTGLVKVFMTVNRLGYHALNLMSDLSTAMIRGTNPADMIAGIRLAKRYIANTLPAEYGGLTDEIAKRFGAADALERQLRLVTKSWGAETDAIAKADATGFAPTIRLVGANGTIKNTKLDPDELVEKMTTRGIFEKNIYINAIQGLDDALILDARDLQKAKFGQKAGARIAQATQVAGKVGGDFASVYSNAIRAAHAQKIINSRTWRSVDEALDFVADELAIFHPTNKSLGSFERRNAAVISTFYTWIRMAHVMVFKMMLENNRELYAINNALYYMNTLNGEQPQSRGTSFSDPEGVADWFRFRSGQLILPGATEEGALGIRTPFAHYEVANLWQFRYDASKNLNENVTSLGEQGLGVLARSGPVVGQLGAKFALGVDPSTGRSVQYNTAGDVVKEFVNLLPALTGPAKGFAGVDLAQETGNIVDRILGTTPKASEQKEVTSDQALIAKINNLLGLSAFQPESEASRKRAKDLEKSRLKEQRRAEREAWQEQQQESE